MQLAQLSDWHGRLDRLAEIVGSYIRRIGNPKMTAPSMRVVRDYIERGIVSPPHRKGSQDRFYRFRHILELIAARLLIADGWPLEKIAEHFRRITDAELADLIEGGSERSSDAPAGLQIGVIASRPTPPTMGYVDEPVASPSAKFGDRALHLSAIRSESETARRRLGLERDAASGQRLTMFTLAPWCRLLIESERLPRLPIEDAELVGRLVAATLLQATRRKGGPKSRKQTR